MRGHSYQPNELRIGKRHMGFHYSLVTDLLDPYMGEQKVLLGLRFNASDDTIIIGKPSPEAKNMMLFRDYKEGSVSELDQLFHANLPMPWQKDTGLLRGIYQLQSRDGTDSKFVFVKPTLNKSEWQKTAKEHVRYYVEDQTVEVGDIVSWVTGPSPPGLKTGLVRRILTIKKKEVAHVIPISMNLVKHRKESQIDSFIDVNNLIIREKKK